MKLNQISEIVATEVNLKTLEVYRSDQPLFYPGAVDTILADLGSKIVEAINGAKVDTVEISLKFDQKEFERMANEFAADLAAEPDNREASTGPDAEHDESRESTGGDSPASLSLDLIEKYWSEAPEWANWWARDEDGAKFFYSEFPLLDTGPSCRSWSDAVRSKMEITKIELAPGCDWKKTARRRPNKKQNDPESPANERETAPDAATATRSKSGPAETSPVIGDEADAGAATKQPKKKKAKKAARKKQEQSEASKEIVEKLTAWKQAHNLSFMEIERRSGVSNVTLHTLVTGRTKNPSPATIKKLIKVMAQDPAEAKEYQPVAETPQLKAKKSTSTDGVINQELKGAGGFLAKQLQTWINRKKCTEGEVSDTLGIERELVNRILGGFVPNESVIYSLAKNLPGVAMHQSTLLKLARTTHRLNGHGTGN